MLYISCSRNKPVPIPSRPQTIHTVNDSTAQKPSHTKVGSPVSQVSKMPSPLQKPHLTEKVMEAGDSKQETVSYKQYSELLERIEKLESLVEKQNKIYTAAIEDLRGRLQVETDLRLMLQSELDKVAQCVMQV